MVHFYLFNPSVPSAQNWQISAYCLWLKLPRFSFFRWTIPAMHFWETHFSFLQSRKEAQSMCSTSPSAHFGGHSRAHFVPHFRDAWGTHSPEKYIFNRLKPGVFHIKMVNNLQACNARLALCRKKYSGVQSLSQKWKKGL